MMKLILNKNRGWRGLAEAQLLDDDNRTVRKMIFSFSQPVWNDMLRGRLVMQDETSFFIIKFTETERLPAPTQQRSVLIKNIVLPVININKYLKTSWRTTARTASTAADFVAIDNFVHNRNNHTQSDWNCIGVRVVPMI